MHDCATPMGMFFMDEQRRVQGLLESKGYIVVGMPSDFAKSDVLICKRDKGSVTLSAVAEIKSRVSAGDVELTRSYLASRGGYLISTDKLIHGSSLSEKLGVPFFIIVSLMSEGVVLMWQVTDGLGNYVEEIPSRVTQTRMTVNGGVAHRTNSFLQMDSKYLTVLE